MMQMSLIQSSAGLNRSYTDTLQPHLAVDKRRLLNRQPSDLNHLLISFLDLQRAGLCCKFWIWQCL